MGWSYWEYTKTTKITAFTVSFSEIFFSENYFEAVLATFCCGYRANAPQAAEKIAANQKDNLKYY